jgi:hypothetical protein
MPLANQGILANAQLSNEQVTPLEAFFREIFINETPFLTRVPRKPAGGTTYNILVNDVRATTYTLTAAMITSDTTFTINDTSPLQVGDILEVQNTAGSATERVVVTAIPSGTTITVTRAAEGTTAVANTSSGGGTTAAITLQGNARFGNEVDQVASRSVRTAIPQYVQTGLYPVQIGGLAQAVHNTALPEGIPDVFTMEQKVKMTEMMRDFENACYYGKGEAPTATVPGKMKGLKTLIGYYNGGLAVAANSNANVKTNGGGSYTMLNFVADGIQKAVDGGGDPDTVLCATDFLTGLATWGFAKQQVNTPRENAIGLPIKEIQVPFTTGPVTFIPSYRMKKGTACVLTSADVCLRYIRQEMYQPRGIRGDAREGDFIADLCAEVGHPGWHSWIEGITSYA